MPPIIEARGLTKVYRKGRHRITALDRLNLEVYAGEIFALVGPNGAGKTTFIKLLLGLRFPTSGQILLQGMSPQDPKARRAVGYQPELLDLPGHLRVVDILKFFGGLSGLSGNVLRQRIDGIIHRLELERDLKTPFRKLSKGLRQRVGLAQALLHDPALLVLDEPTSGLDPVARRTFRSWIQGLHAEGKTILLNTHLIDEVARLAHRMAVLNRGRLLTVERPETLMAHHGDELEAVVVQLIMQDHASE